MGWRIGVDIGGTFTDVALIDEDTGRLGIAKIPTTTQNFAEGVIAGLQQGLTRYGVEPAAVSLLSHATTVVTEPIDAQGDVITPLDETDIDAVIKAIQAAGLDTVAVSFLFSFLNDAHERRVGERLREALPGVEVYLSCEVLPEIHEFERASTTAVCAY